MSTPPLEPVELHPDFAWKTIKPATLADLDNAVQFVAIRKFSRDKQGRLADFQRELEIAMCDLNLGRVIWLHFPVLHAPNSREFLDYCASKGCFIFNVWGYLPGQAATSADGAPADFGEFRPSAEDYKYLAHALGRRFLGYDIGEQDTRYLYSYALLQEPFPLDRRKQYANFFRFFSEMREDLHHHVSILAGTSLVHYQAKENGTQMVGGEALQIHMNINLWYAFIRGAGRQYGLHWFGNASVFNSFGYRDFCEDEQTPGRLWGRGKTSGPSDAMLSSVFGALCVYNSAILGFEHFLYDPAEARPELAVCGRIQRQWMELSAQPRIQKKLHTPVAVLVPFFQGWMPPRNSFHMTTHSVWGGLPYSEGDFQLAALFELFYPGYMDSAAFQDERGFLAATPFGDTMDVLLSDCRPEILDAYDLVILGGDHTMDAEQAWKLAIYAGRGGKILLDVAVENWRVLSPEGWETTPEGWKSHAAGGRITVLNFPHMLAPEIPPRPAYINQLDTPCPLLRTLAPEAKTFLTGAIREVAPLEVAGGGMATWSFNDGETDALLYAVNPHASPRPVTVRLPLSPEHHELLIPGAASPVARGRDMTIELAGLESALIHLKLPEPQVRRRRITWPQPPSCRFSCKVNHVPGSLADILLALPSFRNFFESLIVGPDYLLARDDAALQRDAATLLSRGVSLDAADLTPLFDHYPNLSGIGNGARNGAGAALEQIREAVRRLAFFGCRTLILPPVKNGELAFHDPVALDLLRDFWKRLALFAREGNFKILLKPCPHRFFDSNASLVALLTAPDFEGFGRVLDIAHTLVAQGWHHSIKHGYPRFAPHPQCPDIAPVRNWFPDDYAFADQPRDEGTLEHVLMRFAPGADFLYISAPVRAPSGTLLDAHQPVAQSEWRNAIPKAMKQAPLAGKTLVLDLDISLPQNFDLCFKDWVLVRNIFG